MASKSNASLVPYMVLTRHLFRDVLTGTVRCRRMSQGWVHIWLTFIQWQKERGGPAPSSYKLNIGPSRASRILVDFYSRAHSSAFASWVNAFIYGHCFYIVTVYFNNIMIQLFRWIETRSDLSQFTHTEPYFRHSSALCCSWTSNNRRLFSPN